MLSIDELDKGLKLQAIGRMLTLEHQWLNLVKSKLDQREFFYPKLCNKLDGVANCGIELLGIDGRKMWEIDRQNLDAKSITLVREIKLQSAVNSIGKNSIAFFNIRRQGWERIRDLDLAAIDRLSRFIPGALVRLTQLVIALNVNLDTTMLIHHTVLRNKLVDLETCSFKALREGISQLDPIGTLKSGLINSRKKTLNWANKVGKLACVRHKNVLLRVAHIEYYTKERLYRYRLTDLPNCPRCNQIEDYDHKILLFKHLCRKDME